MRDRLLPIIKKQIVRRLKTATKYDGNKYSPQLTLVHQSHNIIL